MAKPPRDITTGTSRTYFVTAKAWQGHALFQVERNARLLIETIQGYRAQGKFQVHEFVVMPNHIHVLLTPTEDVTLERAMQLIKGGFSYRAGKELGIKGEIWQRGYVDHRIRDFSDYIGHQEYIYRNPVRARLVEVPAAYAYSSAHPGFDLDPPPQGLKPGE